MSITASIVALAVIFVRVPLRKAPKIFSYALWGVVLFRLIFPFSIESVFSLMPAFPNVISQEVAFIQNPVMQTDRHFADFAISTVGQAGNVLPLFGQESGTSLVYALITIAGYIWLSGVVVLLVYAAIGYIGLKRRVYFATLVRDNIFETDKIKTPFVLGAIRPKIYFPTTIDPLRYDYILKHEQIHIKRRDYLIKPFAYIVFALHWFNPLMWIAYFLMSKDMEMSCDEAVLRKADEDIRRDYSMSLLSLSTKRVNLLSPIAFAFGENGIKERIANVLKFKKSANWVTVISVIVVSVFLVGFSSDRVIAIDTQLGISDNISSNPTTFKLIDWHTNDHGFRIANPGEVDEFGRAILNTYFSAFRHDWGNWGNAVFYLTGGAFALELDSDYGELITRPGVVYVDIDFAGRYWTPPFIFNISSVTGELVSASYHPPIEYIATNINPLTPGFEDISVRGNEFLFEAINAEYGEMLLDFSVRLLEQSGFPSDNATSTHFVRFVTGYPSDSFAMKLSDSFVELEVNAVYASGKYATLHFLVTEGGFALASIEISFL
ncbi:MAG: M56 family metallopeptidase [Defluviitaleaceae bacterium]|nr:M56 family metallopeptidase [Defluviitaleaceae bacterium]